jgi:hypothetical protein
VEAIAEKPEISETREKDARKALRKFWIGGLAGAFFAAVTHSLQVDWKASVFQTSQMIFHPLQALSRASGSYTVEVLLRYGYMLWLMGYFFVAVFDLDQEGDSGTAKKHNSWDIAFDVIQFFLATIAIIVLTSVAGQARDYRIDHLAPNTAIALIGGISWLFFEGEAARCKVPLLPFEMAITPLRILTMILGATGAIVGWLSPDPVRLYLLPAFLVLLYWILWSYYRLRIKSSSTGKPRIPAWWSRGTSAPPPTKAPPKEAPVAQSSGETGAPSTTPNPVKPAEVVIAEAPQGGGGSSSENELKKKPEIQP